MRTLLLILLGGCAATVSPHGEAPAPPGLMTTWADTGTDADTGSPMRPVARPVDLLFAIDTGELMGPKQTRLAEAIPVLVAGLDGVDWRATVIGSGSSQLLARVQGSDDPAELQSAVQIGTYPTNNDTSRTEILAALQRHDVVRPDAVLSIVVISTHNDVSPLPETFLDGVHEYSDRVVLSAIVSADPLCPGAQAVGASQIDIAATLDGIFQDICAPNYAVGLAAHVAITTDW